MPSRVGSRGPHGRWKTPWPTAEQVRQSGRAPVPGPPRQRHRAFGQVVTPTARPGGRRVTSPCCGAVDVGSHRFERSTRRTASNIKLRGGCGSAPRADRRDVLVASPTSTGFRHEPTATTTFSSTSSPRSRSTVEELGDGPTRPDRLRPFGGRCGAGQYHLAPPLGGGSDRCPRRRPPPGRGARSLEDHLPATFTATTGPGSRTPVRRWCCRCSMLPTTR